MAILFCIAIAYWLPCHFLWVALNRGRQTVGGKIEAAVTYVFATIAIALFIAFLTDKVASIGTVGQIINGTVIAAFVGSYSGRWVIRRREKSRSNPPAP